jgi:hypothetical protein
MSKILSNGQAVGCENARESLAILQREASHRQRGKTAPKASRPQKNSFNTIEEPVIRVRALFSGSSMVFFGFKFASCPYTIWLWPLNGGRDISSTVASMRKFLELARMTLMEDIVAIEDIDKLYEFSSAAEISTTPLTAIRLQQPRNARPGTP